MSSMFQLNDNTSSYCFNDVASYVVPTKFDSGFCGLRVFQLHLRSMKMLNTFDVFKFYLSKFPHVLDIFVLCETWITPDVTGLCQIPGFKSFSHVGKDMVVA